ncbi:MAG: hypothetical protein WC053_01400 [Sideroxydans sp.]
MRNDLAPIGMSTYGRLQHVQQTIAALQKNELAKESELFIFSDAPKAGDEEKVEAVRRFLRTVDGFKVVHLFEREKNDRVANNRGGMRMLLEKYGRMIFLEEDIVTAPSFLSFMNEALDKYKNDPQIFAVNGYTPPINIPADYQSPVILLPRFAAWGFGMWKKKFDEIIMEITPEMYRELRSDKSRAQQYCQGGEDIITQLWLQAHGFIEALDVRIDYTMFVRGRQYVVCPTKSLAHTTGCDGSGEHWVQATGKHGVEMDVASRSVVIEHGIRPDVRVIKQLSRFYALTLKGKLIKFAMDLGLYCKLRSIKRRWR